MPADGGKHLVGYPAFEFLGFGLVGAEDDIVETTFADNREFLISTKGRNQTPPLFVIIQPLGYLVGTCQFQNFTHILQHPPSFIAPLDSPNLVHAK